MFDLHRFLRLASVQWAEYGRGYLWFLAIGIAVHLCVVLLIATGGMAAYALDMQIAVFVVGYLLTSGLFAGRYFSALARRESALTLLMRPASSFEKWMLAVLVVAVLYPIAFTLAFQVCNLPGAWLAEAARDAEVIAIQARGEGVPVYLVNSEYGPYLPFGVARSGTLELHLLAAGAALQGLVVAGTLYFRHLALTKTLVFLFVLAIILIPLLSVVTGANPARLFFANESAWLRPLPLSWIVIVWTGVPALFWLGNLFLLREREVQ